MLELARLGVAARPGYAPPVDNSDRIELFELEPHDVSSSEIRARVRRGEPIDGLVVPAVAAYIAEHGLYRSLTPLPGYTEGSELARASTPDRRCSRGEKLAEDVVILDMRPVCVYTDFFVLATGRNPRQTKAIFDEVHAQLKQEDGLLPRAVDGAEEAEWIIADYLDVVLHVFTPETRAFYRLEELWGDVPAVEVEAATA